MTADAATRFGRYDLLAHLATGGMAEIFLARAEGAAGFAKLVVVKRLLESLAGEPEYVEMFLDEARIAARLSHTNVVQCLDLGEVDGRYFMAMEYVAGLSVAQVGKLATRRLGKVPQEIAAGIVVQAAAGLHSAHEQRAPDGTPLGIVHRDVSPQNLLLTNEGIVKLVDFGIAKAAGRATNTRAGVIKGKFGYLSPEQCVGEAIDRRSDVFALGIVLFELCTSRRLFKRGSTLHTYEAIASCQVPDPRSLNPAIAPPVAAVIKRALAKGAGERFQTAEEFGGALEEAMRRSALDGTSTALATFLERHFAPELEQQRALVEQADRGALRGRKKVAQEDAAPEMEAVDDPADNEPTTAWAGEATAIDADDHAETVMDDAPPGFGEGEATSLDEDLPDDEHTVEGGPFALPPPAPASVRRRTMPPPIPVERPDPPPTAGPATQRTPAVATRPSPIIAMHHADAAAQQMPDPPTRASGTAEAATRAVATVEPVTRSVPAPPPRRHRVVVVLGVAAALSLIAALLYLLMA